eukprot:GILK01005505.1.p1 GENE.GILK01005505.1~~GILK01005505.1.p1  ORF type:complete len:636 (-),score=101.26 GILK01005505.1:368-2242(-)
MSSLKAYTILRHLDNGANGQVLLAERNKDKKQFAIKVFNASDESVAFRYLEEALLSRNLQHPYIIASETAFSDFSDNFGTRMKVVCVVMEYANGGNLRQLIQKRRNDNRRFAEGEILDICICTLEALHYAHAEHDLVHRDVKPANILICNETIKVADFGESKRLLDTLTHSVRGTPSYMAPEVRAQFVSGESGARYGPKADVFSVGMVVLDMATLEQGGRDLANVRERMSGASGHYSAEFMQWLTSMVEQDPSRRLSMEEALQQAIECKSMVTFVPGSSAGEDREAASAVIEIISVGSGVDEDAATIVGLEKEVMTDNDSLTPQRNVPSKTSSIFDAAMACVSDESSTVPVKDQPSNLSLAEEEALRKINDVRGGKSAVNRDAVSLIVKTMKLFSTSETVQSNACAALWHVSINSENLAYIADAGGIDLIVAAMGAFPKSEGVQGNACGALSNLHVHAGKSAAILRGIDSIKDAMREFPLSEDVQRNACRALWSLSASGSNGAFIPPFGGIELILAAMRAFPQAEAVQENACGALWNLAFYNGKNQASIVTAGGIELIAAAMRRFPQSEGVQQRACETLCHMSIAFQKEIDIAGGFRLIEAAIRAFPRLSKYTITRKEGTCIMM